MFTNDFEAEDIEAVATGIQSLTPRETQVFKCVLNGETNKETALLLEISPRTVEVHRVRIRQKLGGFSWVEIGRIVSIVESKEPPAKDRQDVRRASRRSWRLFTIF